VIDGVTTALADVLVGDVDTVPSERLVRGAVEPVKYRTSYWETSTSEGIVTDNTTELVVTELTVTDACPGAVVSAPPPSER
jgi:hypothetical protein